jgi:hypothetical protein
MVNKLVHVLRRQTPQVLGVAERKRQESTLSRRLLGKVARLPRRSSRRDVRQ